MMLGDVVVSYSKEFSIKIDRTKYELNIKKKPSLNLKDDFSLTDKTCLYLIFTNY